VEGLEPSRGSLEGGTTLTVSGRGLASGMACRVGSVGPVSGRRTGESALECVTPAGSVLGAVSVEAGHMGARLTSDGAAFVYAPRESISALIPRRVLSGAGSEATTVVAYGSTAFTGFGESCEVGGQRVPAEAQGPVRVACLVGGVQGAGFVSLSVGGVSAAESWRLELVGPSAVTSVQPRGVAVGGGELLWVSGRGFDGAAGEAGCLVGGAQAMAAWAVSSALMACESPGSLAEGVMGVEATSAGRVQSSSGAVVMLTAEASVEGLEPSRGSLEGGTTLTVSGRGLASGMACRVGSVGPVSGRRTGESALECVSPAGILSDVGTDFHCHLSTARLFLQSASRFSYEMPPVLEFAFPNSIFRTSSNSAVEIFWSSTPYRSTLNELKPLSCGFEAIAIPVGSFDSVMFVHVSPDVHVHSISPNYVSVNGGTVITLSGNHFPSIGAACTVGGAIVEARFTSTVLIACEAPPGDSGPAAIGLANVQGAPAIVTFAPDAVLSTLNPVTVSEIGGAPLSIHGHFNSDVHGAVGFACRQGSIGPFDAVTASAGAVTCTSVAHTPRVGVSMIAALASTGQYMVAAEPGALALEVVRQSHADGAETAVIPASGPREGGIIIRLFGAPLSVLSAFVAPFGEGDAESSAQGLLKSSTVSGFVAVRQSAGAAVEFEYVDAPVLRSISPRGAWEGGVAKAVGAGFVPSAVGSCRFAASTSAPATFVSSSLVLCEVPAVSHEDIGSLIGVSVAPAVVSSDDDVFSGNNNGTRAAASFGFGGAGWSTPVPHELLYEPHVSGMDVQSGWAQGGTLVRLSGRGLAQRGPAAAPQCRFGTIGPLAPRLKVAMGSGGGVECVSPAHAYGSVDVALTLNAEQFTSSRLPFEYE